MSKLTLVFLAPVLLLSSCAYIDNYGGTVRNTAGSTCADGVGGCTPDEDQSGDFVNY